MSNVIPYKAKQRTSKPLASTPSANETYADVITFLSVDDDVQAVYETLRAAGYRQ